MAPNTVRDSKLSNEKENHLWKIEMREMKKEKNEEETFSLQVFLSLATCISCNSLEAHSFSKHIHSFTAILSLFTADNVHFLCLYGRNDEI